MTVREAVEKILTLSRESWRTFPVVDSVDAPWAVDDVEGGDLDEAGLQEELFQYAESLKDVKGE